MTKNNYFKNILLIAEVCLLCFAVVVIRAFSPGLVLPRISIPMLTVLSVVPMIISGYMEGQGEEGQPFSLLLAGLTFTLLPFLAGWTAGVPLWKIFAAGTVVYGITEILYTSMLKRIASGSRAPLAPVVDGMVLWLASQCFQGML